MCHMHLVSLYSGSFLIPNLSFGIDERISAMFSSACSFGRICDDDVSLIIRRQKGELLL